MIIKVVKDETLNGIESRLSIIIIHDINNHTECMQLVKDAVDILEHRNDPVGSHLITENTDECNKEIPGTTK